MNTTHWIAIDWGTTNFRAFLIDGAGAVTARTAESLGLLQVKDRDFAGTLARLLQPWLASNPQLPVLMAGMVGSRNGWLEVPYMSTPCALSALARHVVTVPWQARALIIPGITGMSLGGQPDVMRGEEVQLLGLTQLQTRPHCTAILPGTHSKHAQLVGDTLQSFATFMTGELFSLLSKHSILGRGLPPQTDDESAFVSGVLAARKDPELSRLLFSVRTRLLAGLLPAPAVHSYLSGLLLGAELAGLPADTHAWVIGAPALCERYQLAAQHLGMQLEFADGDDCFIAGMRHLHSLLEPVTGSCS
ncbi:2-dehydro-3-deoxygalactonokinase [Silvimonas terrae]|uniref:2-dehydro-3-deoxygalactonokinase n=1 Tax=Silvimonas terrae TaxID=300266 RepID=A0A840RAE1_9NEIS|nr:2-dehydro-3-deoxygalactonokinase [Silvimonas terrae]MBB5189877.1 2-dehydro-3-deoxygalactonokinase [Silvimonas terrae]